MEELVKTFHIDWKLLVAQLVNFFIVLGVLWKFALKPLQQLMDKRSAEIDKSLKQAKEIEQKLSEADKTKAETIIEAKKEAQNIISQAGREAENVRTKKLDELKSEMEKIVAQTKSGLQQEKEEMIKAARGEVADMVVAATGKIISQKLDSGHDKQLIEETIKKL